MASSCNCSPNFVVYTRRIIGSFPQYGRNLARGLRSHDDARSRLGALCNALTGTCDLEAPSQNTRPGPDPVDSLAWSRIRPHRPVLDCQAYRSQVPRGRSYPAWRTRGRNSNSGTDEMFSDTFCPSASGLSPPPLERISFPHQLNKMGRKRKPVNVPSGTCEEIGCG